MRQVNFRKEKRGMKKFLKLEGSQYFKYMDLPLRIVSAGVGKTDEGHHHHDYTFINHYHSFSEMVLINEGRGVQNINGVDYKVEKGDLFLMDGATTHYFRKGSCCHIVNILYEKKNLGLPWELLRQSRGYNMFFEVEPQGRSIKNFRNHLRLNEKNLKLFSSYTRNISNQVKIAEEEENVYSKLDALKSFVELIIFISRLSEHASESYDSVLPGISRVIAMLETDFGENHTLDTMASAACTSPRNFSRQFSRVTGETPGNYLLKIRMQNALKLLRNSDLSIDLIASRCGFSDSCYFSKTFSRCFGITARECRKLFKESDESPKLAELKKYSIFPDQR